jgi:hypothetical protein
LVEIAAKFFEGGADFIFRERRDRPLLNNVTLPILRTRRQSERESSDVFLVIVVNDELTSTFYFADRIALERNPVV